MTKPCASRVNIIDKRTDVWSRPSCIYTQIISPGKTGLPLGVVHKLRLQEEVGRYFKNVNFHKVESVNEGGLVIKKPKSCQRSL